LCAQVNKKSSNVTVGYKYASVFAQYCYTCEMWVSEEGAHVDVRAWRLGSRNLACFVSGQSCFLV